MVVLALLTVTAVWAVEDITFLQIADPHVPHALSETQEVVAALPVGEPVLLEPWGITADPPAFGIVVGDLNEFSGGAGWWEQYMGLWDSIDLPLYHQLGNHDNTWECGRPRLRALHGSALYAFQRAGVLFIGLDTATPQDPRPSIATEGLALLDDVLSRAPAGQPIILFCHHPLEGREFAGAYDLARLLDRLRAHNTILVLVGHGHSARAWRIEGLDTVMGGSTWGKRRGYGIVSIRDGILRVCHRHLAPESETVALLEKPIVEAPPPLVITSVEPADGAVLRADDPLRWHLGARSDKPVTVGTWLLDGEVSGAMSPENGAWTADLTAEDLEPGAHVLRLEVTDAGGRSTSRTVSFWVDSGDLRIAWTHQLPGSCQSTPAVVDGALVVGSNDGSVSAIDAATGELRWRKGMTGEVRGSPAVGPRGERIYVASAGGTVLCLEPDGRTRWFHAADAPIYASPLVIGDRVICPTNGGSVLALNADTGEPAWQCEAPEYAIESGVAVGGARVYAGAWDCFVYCIDLATGELHWRQRSAGSDREGFVARYYSPADCAPALARRMLFVADRAYRLTLLDAVSGRRLSQESKCVAVAAAADGRHVYVRHTDGRVSKRAEDGSVVWSAEVSTGAVAAPPTEAGGRVWVASNTGILSGMDAATGRVLAQYRATRDIYVFASPACAGERVFVADAAGRIIALEPR
ncbi:MAG: PQQ-binding-like beta-propeller repeat protein [Armatimonadota bacterium]|nr:PQQ-binding-like beta-propeller repeat protein [Armatimonadota bacterium]